MSRGFSRVILVGNLGRDPEMRYSQNGTPITNFTIAVNRRKRNPDGSQQDETDWYRISLFRQQAEFAAEWLKKGSKVLVEGQLQIRTYTGQDGVERTSVEVNADNFQNLTTRDEQAALGGGDQSYRSNQGGGYGGNTGGGGGYNQRQEQPAPRGGNRPAPPADDDDPFADLDDVPF
jgi:single-strand DNA-binding protein